VVKGTRLEALDKKNQPHGHAAWLILLIAPKVGGVSLN